MPLLWKAMWQSRYLAPLALFHSANALAITPLLPSFCNDGRVDAALKSGDVEAIKHLVAENLNGVKQGDAVRGQIDNIPDRYWNDLFKKSQLDDILFSGSMKIFIFSENRNIVTESLSSENKSRTYKTSYRTGLMFRCSSSKISEFEWLNLGITTRDICEQKALND